MGKFSLLFFFVRAQYKELSQWLFLSTCLIVRLLNPFANLPVSDVWWARGEPRLAAHFKWSLMQQGWIYLLFFFFGISTLPLENHSVPYFAITFACCMIFPVSKYNFFSLLDARGLFSLGSWPLVYSVVIWVVSLLVTSHICLTSDLSC